VEVRQLGNPLDREYQFWRITDKLEESWIIWGYECPVGWIGCIVYNLEPVRESGFEITWQRTLHTGEVIT
jgi:hypothetical protein